MGLTGATVLLVLVLTAAVFGLASLRRRLHDGGDAADLPRSRLDLAANWAEVERAAARGGMDAEQIAEVRRRVLGG